VSLKAREIEASFHMPRIGCGLAGAGRPFWMRVDG
jgi:hypothetical protein